MSCWRGRALAVLGLILLVPAGILVFRGSGILPLDEGTVGRFQAANSRATRELLEDHRGMSPPLRAAMAFRRAVNETGYDPDKTLRYWVSPEFKLDVADGDPAKAVTRIRQAESLIATALGDGTNDEEFEEILSYLDADLRETAKQRRVDKR